MRILMTVDAVGGVWRYAVDLAGTLAAAGHTVVLAGLGPVPSAEQRAEAGRVARLVWLETPPDWLAENEQALDALPAELSALAREHAVDLVHLNAPSQACGLDASCPVVAVSHSCVVTWFRAVRDEPLAPAWSWQRERNRAGFDRADRVVAPSRSHAAMLEAAYGAIDGLTVVHNAGAAGPAGRDGREDIVAAAARWWDQGKNGAVLDAAARLIGRPVLMAGPLTGPNGQGIAIRHAQALGSLGNDAVRDLMARAAVFVSPSLYEPFGLAALEAAHSGAALVLADIPTYRELWADAALFFPPRDPAALATAVNRLLSDRAAALELGRKAAARADAFSLQRQASEMTAIYRQLVQPAMAVS